MFLPGYSPELAQAYALEPAPLESVGVTVLIVIALAMAYWSPVVSEHFDRPNKTSEGAAVH